ncbi:MAG: undecaprenyl/decaprenyl-phosphate alpha-N-acetylglucosaminyl 1-phosphate transferase [Saprospiraceae bacterium]|nr:undecaprenyl/decaprenyl-phosphate alpha-N-acetylglucosaminyl 1-phosphate transferase [Saprospiraceae bacterium]
MFDVILSFITAFTLTYFAIPSIINVAKVKNLCDEPGERTSHSRSIPTLGGVAIFAGVLFSIIFWTPFSDFGELQYILCSFVIIFLIGVKDDIISLSPTKKFLGQLFASLLLVLKSKITIPSLFGIFGFYDLPFWVTIIFSVFVIMVIINAFNLIDGINGLSGSIGLVISLTLGSWFLLIDKIELSILAFSLAGSLIAFLKYNFTPSRIFMGDTGSMLIGLITSTLVIEFIEYHHEFPNGPFSFQAAPAVAFGMLILPLFDTLRVFVIRVLKGKSPFQPDRNHIHHMLIDIGLTHMQATGILILVNIIFIVIVATLQDLGNISVIAITISLAWILTTYLFFVYNKKIKSDVKSSKPEKALTH